MTQQNDTGVSKDIYQNIAVPSMYPTEIHKKTIFLHFIEFQWMKADSITRGTKVALAPECCPCNNIPLNSDVKSI